MKNKIKKERRRIVRIFTVADSLGFVTGMLPQLSKEYDVTLVTSPGPQLDALNGSQEGRVRTRAVAMQRRMSPLKDIVSLWRLAKVLRREKPAMVHSMTPKAGLLGMMAAWLTRVPIRVHTFTGLVFPTSKGLTRKILMLTDRLTCAFATHIVPEGEGVKNDLINHRITRKPLRVLGHGNVKGVDLERFARTTEVMARAAEIRRADTFTFVFVGRLVGDKGINELTRAFARLNREMPHTRLLLVGPEEQNIDPLSEVTRREIASNTAIEAVGLQSDVRPWLAAADAFVLPSYREGFPNVVIEAGAMGLPSIVTDINGSREIISDGVNGVIVPPRDTAALYSAMRRFATDRAMVGTLASRARDMVASRFEQGYVRRCLLDFYREIMNKTS